MADSHAVERMRQAFDSYFDDADIHLPESPPARGEVKGGGWTVQYVFGEDGQGKPYLDFFAENRHSNSRHVRIHANGESEMLENYQEGMVFPPDVDPNAPDAWGKAEAARQEHNRRVDKILRDKGLIGTG